MWTKEELKDLAIIASSVKPAFDFVRNENEDEMFVIRENGERQGIFKIFAMSVIPFLEAGRIDLLAELWPEIAKKTENYGFYGAMEAITRDGILGLTDKTIEAMQIYSAWYGRVSKSPMRLARSLQRARINCWLLDKMQAEYYSQRQLPECLADRLSELVNRWVLAYAWMIPFYHIEALVGDSSWLDVNEAETDQDEGILDLVAFLLPSAFSEEVVTSVGDWNGLDWPQLYSMSEKVMRSRGRKASILLNLSYLTGAPVHHILFAANALNFIPKKVGGRKGESDPEKDLDELYRMLLNKQKENEKSILSVLSEINALIRFLNWLPLIESEDNFIGQNWNYALVSDTSAQLLSAVIEHPEIWQDGFADIFSNELLPQLENLDANSTKGRFLLQLMLIEKRLRPDFSVSIDDVWQNRVIEEILSKSGERLKPVNRIFPLGLVGNKPLGIALLGQSLGDDFINSGFSISTSQVESYLKENDEIWQKILRLDSEDDLRKKILLAENVRNLIFSCPLPDWFLEAIQNVLDSLPGADIFAIRSSSLDEGEARGVYATFLRVGRLEIGKQVKECIALYFSNEAVSFRATDKTGDIPFFAILIQPYVDSIGGVDTCVTEGDKFCYVHSLGSSAEEITSSDKAGMNIKRSFIRLPRSSDIPLSWRALEKLVHMFGPVQIEYSLNGRLILHQMEFIPLNKVKPEKMNPTDYLEISNEADIASIKKTLCGCEERFLSLNIGKKINLNAFQGELLSILAHFGNRVVEIRTEKAISQTSHFANICRHFGIKNCH